MSSNNRLSTRLGAVLDGDGVMFALVAPHATAVEVCWFDSVTGQQELGRCWAQRRFGSDIWQVRVAGLGLGTLYGWRVHGPWAPAQGWRFNAHKLLLDPYAREVFGAYDGSDLHVGHSPFDAAQLDLRDNARTALKAQVVADLPPLQQPRPQVDPAKRVLYELHLKSYTMSHPQVPHGSRGRYEGMLAPAVLAHLRHLGVTTLSFMPLAQRVDEARLLAQGLNNHWGYNTVAWLAPETRYAHDPQRVRYECRAMVEGLHAAGFEVVLDVVFNHSAESDAGGPTLSLRGIDNRLYYVTQRRNPAQYHNWAGCGNVLDINQPWVLRLVMDSLRCWVEEFGIDGFRFDLAPVLGRDATSEHRFQRWAPLFMALAQDPLLRDRLLIAEPWDVGPNGYQLGQFPPTWLEWNDLFRDTQRSVWLHQHGAPGRWAQALAGSSAVFGTRTAHSSVNFVTAHDGFTLQDLVSYQHKHNHANGEENRDGHAHNLSHNHGAEGPSSQPEVQWQRRRSQRALLASTLLALGTPMLLAGDELGHSQHGNNNAYCQDNPMTWLDWQAADAELIQFVAGVLALRAELPVLQAHGWWCAGSDACPQPGVVAHWLTTDGQALTAREWQQDTPLPMAIWLLPTVAEQAAALWLLNPTDTAVVFTLPAGDWTLRLDTHVGSVQAQPLPTAVTVPPSSLLLATAALASADDEGAVCDFFP